jgi:hypothetical protein
LIRRTLAAEFPYKDRFSCILAVSKNTGATSGIPSWVSAHRPNCQTAMAQKATEEFSNNRKTSTGVDDLKLSTSSPFLARLFNTTVP